MDFSYLIVVPYSFLARDINRYQWVTYLIAQIVVLYAMGPKAVISAPYMTNAHNMGHFSLNSIQHELTAFSQDDNRVS